MDGARTLLLFCLAIISTDLATKGGLPHLSEARPGTNSGYGIMGTTDEEDSEKWAKEQEKAFKKLQSDWFRRRFSGSGSGSGSGIEGSGSGSNSEKANKPFQMLKNRLRNPEFKLGHKRQMGYGVQSFSETDTSKVINQAVAETIQENTTEPPPMPPTMPKTTSPVEPYTYLPNMTFPPSKVTVNEVSETTTVSGPGTASSSVNLKGVGSQNLSLKTSQKSPSGDETNSTYITKEAKPGQPVTLNAGNNSSNINLVETISTKGNDQASSYGYYARNSGSPVQQQQFPTLNGTVPGLPQIAEVQPTVTPLTPATYNNTASFPYSYTNQNQMETTLQNSQAAPSSNNQVEGYASTLPNSTTSNMNPVTAVTTSEETNNNGNSSSTQPSVSGEPVTNYYLGGVQLQNSSSISGQQSQTLQESLPTRSTLQWQNPTQPVTQDAGQNPNSSVSPTQRANLTYGGQITKSEPFAIQKTENQKPSFSIQFQTEVANPTKSQSFNIRPIHIGRFVSHDKDGRLIISSSSTYEIGQNVLDAGSSYQGSTASNGTGSIQNTQQASDANGFRNNTTYINSPANKPNTLGTEGYSNQENHKAIPTIYVSPPKNATPTPPSWLPTYSLLKSMKTGGLDSQTQPDQTSAEASINITEILVPEGDKKGLPVMVMQSPSTENNPTVEPPPNPLIDTQESKINESTLGNYKFQLPNVGQTQGPIQGQTQGPTKSPSQIITQSQTQGPTNGPNQKSSVRPTQGPTKILTQKLNQGQAPTSAASTSIFALGSNPTVVGTVNPTARISTATSKLPTVESSASLVGVEEKTAGNMSYVTPNIQENGTISLPGSQTDELTAKEMENMMHVEDNEETLFGKESMGGVNGDGVTLQKPTQAMISQGPTADPYKDVKDALLSVDIAQLRPGELLSLRLPNSHTSDIFQVKDIKSNEDVSAFSSDLDLESGSVNHGGSRDKKHMLYAIIEKVKHNKNYRNAMKALFSTGDRRSWNNTKKMGSFVNRKSKPIELPQRAILRSYSKDELNKKNEENFSKLLQENIGSVNVAGSHSFKEANNPDIEFDQVHHDVEKYVKKDNIDANTLRAKLMSVGAKLHRLHRKSGIEGSKRSGIHRHRHYTKKTSSDERGSKKTEGTFEVTLKVSGKKKKGSEDKTKEDDDSEKTENKLKPGSKLKFKGTFTDGKEESGEEDKVKNSKTEQTTQGLKPNGQPGNVIIEDEKGNILYKGPVDIAALNQTVTKKGGKGTGFQLQNVGYRVDPSVSSEENVILKQGLQQVMPKKRSGRLLHRRYRIDMQKEHFKRNSRSIEIANDVKATKKTDGTFKLTLKVSDVQKGAASPETNKEGKDDVNMNDPSQQLFHDDKKVTFSGTFTDGEDSKDENKKKEKKEKEEEEEEEEEEGEEEENKKEKKKKGKKEEKEEEKEEEDKQKKKKGKKEEKEEKVEEKEEEDKEKNKKGKKDEKEEKEKKKEKEEEKEEEDKEKKKKKKKGEKEKEKEEESEEESKEKKKGEKTPEKEISNQNSQSNTTAMAQPKGNATNVIIEDGKGNILYKGPVDIAALNKTVSTKNGTYSGFHLETAGYKFVESTDPQEIELLNDGLQHAIRPNSASNLSQLFEPKRKRRSLLEDSQPSKKTDGTFTLTLALKDDKKKKKEKESKDDQQEKDYKSDKDGYYSDFQQKGDKSNKEARRLEKAKRVEGDKTTSEKVKNVSPHVIIEDELGKPLYQGPVDITALNKSVASKGGSMGYELQKTGYQLVKDPYQNQPAASQSEAKSSQNDAANQESSDDSSNPTGQIDQVKQQTDDSGTNIIKISSSNGDAPSNSQGEQQFSVDVRNDEGSEYQSIYAGGKEQQSMGAFQKAPNTKPSEISSNKKEPEDGPKFPSYSLEKLNDQKASISGQKPLFSFKKENAQQQPISNVEIKHMQNQLDEIEQHKGHVEENSPNSKTKNRGQNGLDQHQVSVTSTSFVDTTNSKLLHIYKSKPEFSSKNRKEENSKGNVQSLPSKMPSDKSKESLGSLAKLQTSMELDNKENTYKVLLTDAQNGVSSIGGKILEPAPIIDEQKALEQNEGLAQMNSMANTIPNDGQVDSPDSSFLNNKNSPSQNGLISKNNLAFLTQNRTSNARENEANMKAPASPMSLAVKNVGNSFPKKYQVLKLTRNKLKELLASSANTANSISDARAASAANTPNTASNVKGQQQFPGDTPMQDNPKVDKNGNIAPNNGMEQPITLILSGPYLDQLEPHNSSTSPQNSSLSNDKLQTASLPNNALSNGQIKTASQANPNAMNITQESLNGVNALLNNPEDNNITTMLPNEMFGNDDDKILIGGGGKTVRPAAEAEGVFKSQETASGLNVLLKTPEIQNPAFLLQSKNASPLKISSNNLQGTEAMPTISVLSGSGQRVDCHALPAGSSLTLLRCGPNGQRIVGPTVSTISKDQAASMLNLQMNDMPPQNPVPQHQLTEPDTVQNILEAPDIRMNDEPPRSSNQHANPTKQEYGYGTVTNPALYHKMSTDIKDYLDKEMNDEKKMIQNLLVGSSTPRASLPSQNNDDTTDEGLPFGFEYIPGASESNLYNMETRNQQMYQGFPNEYMNALSNPGMSRRPHKAFRSRSKHRNIRRSQIRKAFHRPGPWKRRKSSRKRVRRFPVRHWSFREMFPPPLPLLIHPLYPQPWLLTKRCCSDIKNNEKEKCKCTSSSTSPSKNENLPTPAPSSMSEWEYLGRVLCSCPCCIECVDW